VIEALKFLDGKKTYIVSLVMACVAFAYSMDWIDEKQLTALEAFLAAIGFGTIRHGIKKAEGLILLLFLSVPCAAQTVDPGYASYRIWCGNGAGSCTGIAPDLVATNVHVAGVGGASCRIAHPLTNREWRGQTVAGDRDADVALVLISSADLDWVYLGDDPVAGKPCFHYGYGGGTVLKGGTGQYLQPLGKSWYASTSSVSGDSGGGIFDEQGRLCSVNWGSTDVTGGQSISTPVSYVARLLARYRGNPQQPRQQQQQPISRGGRPAPKQPIQLGPKRLVDPLKDFDADAFVKILATRFPGGSK